MITETVNNDFNFYPSRKRFKMKVELQRYAKREGIRQSDCGSYVGWDITVDEDNKKIIIKTENNVYVKDLK